MFTFSFDRYSSVTPALLCKLQTARNLRAVIVSTPSSVKSFMLKFLEFCHNLSRHKNLQMEKKESNQAASIFTVKKVRSLLGLGNNETKSSGMMTKEEVVAARLQAVMCDQIFEIFRNSIEIMDEVDIILHPLKSELNWPLGAKEPLDFTRSRIGNGLRWGLPSHLLDAIFSCCGIPIIADIADSKVASKNETVLYIILLLLEIYPILFGINFITLIAVCCYVCCCFVFVVVGILDELQEALEIGFNGMQLQKSPHLALVSKNFYE